MSKQVETVKVTVDLVKAQVDHIKSQEWFKQYRSFEDFVEEAVREHMLRFKRVYER